MVSYTETVYHPFLRAIGCLIAWNSMAYAVSGYGMLCRDFAAHRCYEETVQTLLGSGRYLVFRLLILVVSIRRPIARVP